MRINRSQLLREGYIKGLRQAQRIINEMLDDDANYEYVHSLPDAAKKGDYDECERLLKAGEDVNDIDFGENTALILAAKNGEYDICELLLKHGADVNAKDYSGYTALDWAEHNKVISIVKLLKRHGARR